MIDNYKTAFNEVWLFFKDKIDIKDDDAYWQGVITDSDNLYEKYKSTSVGKIVKDFLIICVCELSRMAKAKRKQESK